MLTVIGFIIVTSAAHADDIVEPNTVFTQTISNVTCQRDKKDMLVTAMIDLQDAANKRCPANHTAFETDFLSSFDVKITYEFIWPPLGCLSDTYNVVISANYTCRQIFLPLPNQPQ